MKNAPDSIDIGCLKQAEPKKLGRKTFLGALVVIEILESDGDAALGWTRKITIQQLGMLKP